MNQYQNKNEWLEEAREVATGMISGDALRFTKSWQQWVGQPVEVPVQDQYLEGLRQNLLLTVFAVAPDEQMKYALQYLTLQFFLDNEYQLPAITKVEDRISAAGEGLYDEERLKIRKALEESQVRFGGLSVKECLVRFEKFHNTSSADEVTSFLLTENQISNISEREKQALRNILEVYESYLRYPVLTLSSYLASEQNGSLQLSNQGITQAVAVGKAEKLPLLKAMNKYGGLGNQVITQARLKLKNQAEPARGSVTNWLRVYRDELGIGRHDSATRAKFLFESQNTKNLSADERERVHDLIRSLEDEELLTINTETKEIIFVRETQPALVPKSGAAFQQARMTQQTPEDVFERFNKPADTEQPHQTSKPKPASALPTPLRSVGTSHFGEVSARPEKNKEEEKAILERIRKMNTVVPKEPAHTAQTVSANQPMGKLTFSAPQVFASENSRPQTPPPATTPMAPTVRLEPVATSSQTITIAKPAAPIVSHQTVTTSLPSKLVVTPQEVKKPHPDRSMFHIKPNRDE